MFWNNICQYAWQFGPVPKDIWFNIKSGDFEKEFCSDICIMPHDEESEKQGYEILAIPHFLKALQVEI